MHEYEISLEIRRLSGLILEWHKLFKDPSLAIDNPFQQPTNKRTLDIYKNSKVVKLPTFLVN